MSEQETVQEAVQTDTTPQFTQANSSTSLVAEAKRYRKRAQAAEKELNELKETFAEREKSFSEQAQKVADLERQQAIDAELLAAGTIDLDVARVLTERTLAETEDGRVDEAVHELRQRKPYLFRSISRPKSDGIQSPRSDNDPSARSVALKRAANEAATTGHRHDLLRYLRLRRKQK